MPRLLSDDTASVPPLMAHEVTVLVVPVSVQVLVPVFWKMPKPWYCAVAPICETSKLAFVVPPSASVSAVLNAMTLPVIDEPNRSSRVLVPPVNVMALARVTPSPDRPPVTVPLLMTVSPEPTMPAPPAPALPFTPPPAALAVPPAPPLPPAMMPELFSVPPLRKSTPMPPAPPLPPPPQEGQVLPAFPPAPPVPPLTVPVLV